MNGIVGRKRADAMSHNLGTLQRPNLNTTKTVGLQNGQSISFTRVPDQPRKLTLTLTGFDGKLPDLVINGKKISLSEQQPVPMSERQQKTIEGSRMMRDFSAMMRTINKDPGLKEVQSHINNAHSVVTEMAGFDPVSPEEMQESVQSLTELSDKLDEAMDKLDERPLNLDQNPIRNPVPRQRDAILQLKGMIEDRIKTLLDFVPPEKGQDIGPEQKLDNVPNEMQEIREGKQEIPDGKQEIEPEIKTDVKSKVKGDMKAEGKTLDRQKLEPKAYTGPSPTKVLSELPGKLKDLQHLANDPEKGKLSKSVLDGIDKAMTAVKNGLSFLKTAPGDATEMKKLAASLNEVLMDLADLAKGPLKDISKNPDFKSVSGDVKNLIDGAKQQLGRVKDSLLLASTLNPLSTKAIFHSKSFSTIGAKNFLTEKLKEAEKNFAQLQLENPQSDKLPWARDAVKVLSRAVDFLEKRVDQLLSNNSDDTVSLKEARKLMGSKKADHGIEDDEAADVLRDVLNKKMDLLGDGPLEPLKKSGLYLREDGIMQIFVDFALQQAGFESPKDLRTQLTEQRFQALNSQKWKPISKEVLMQRGTETFAMKSDIVPQSNLGRHFDDMKGGGVVCHASRNFEHGTTVAVSRLTAPDGTVLFEGVRHGILNPYGISSQSLHKLKPEELKKMVENLLPKENWKTNIEGNADWGVTADHIMNDKAYRRECASIMQANGSDRRVLDLVTTNLLKNESKLKLALDQVGKPNPEPVTINLNSIGLVTPDHFRALSGKSGPGNERKMLLGQLDALHRLAEGEQPVKLKIKDANGELKEVLVNVKVNTFNFGVNGGAFKARGLVGAWGTSDKYNERAMDSLIGPKSKRKESGIGGEVQKWLDDNPNAPEKTRRVVLTLAQQVARMWDDKSHHIVGNEPYKMVSRLGLLSSMIGGDTCWNCKSGKDRTGQMDVETKRLAAEIWMNDTVPEPDVEPDVQTKSNRFRMAMDGGNLELQNYNTGAPGFKLTGVQALEDQMNMYKDDPRYEYFTGIAGFYGT